MRDTKRDITFEELRRRPFPSPAPLPERVVPAEPVFNADDFTEPQMLAMMQMSDQLRHQAIWHKLRENYEVPPFTRSTFLELRTQNFAVQPEGLSFHRLTDAGEKLARPIADYLQHKFKVHQHYMLGRSGPTVTMQCTCGWGCALRAGDNMHIKASNAMSRHLQTVAAMDDLATALVPRKTGAG